MKQAVHQGLGIDEIYRQRVDAVVKHQLELMPPEYRNALVSHEADVKEFLYDLIPLMKSANSNISGFGPYPSIS